MVWVAHAHLEFPASQEYIGNDYERMNAVWKAYLNKFR